MLLPAQSNKQDFDGAKLDLTGPITDELFWYSI